MRSIFHPAEARSVPRAAQFLPLAKRLGQYTFHPFIRLPAELRSEIWKLSIEPRIVDVEMRYNQLGEYYPRSNNDTPYLVSRTPVPAVLQTCQEARNEGLYLQAFSELAGLGNSRRRYVWLALDIDVIDIGETPFNSFEPVASVIQRLRFERSNSEEYFYHSESRDLRIFVNVKEIQIVCADGIAAWHGATEEHYFPCGSENVFLVGPEEGEMTKATELDDMLDQEYKEDYFRDH